MLNAARMFAWVGALISSVAYMKKQDKWDLRFALLFFVLLSLSWCL